MTTTAISSTQMTTTAQLARSLWHSLWERYRQRVPYARTYEAMIEAAGGQIANDHIAFRSLRLSVDGDDGPINLGIPYLAPVVEGLGYEVADTYTFGDRHLYAQSYRHPLQAEFALPKLFISELMVDELPLAIANQIRTTVQSGTFYPQSHWWPSKLAPTPPQPSPYQGEGVPAVSPLSFREACSENVGGLRGVSARSQWPQTQAFLNTTQESYSNHPQPKVHDLATVFTRPWSPPKRSIVEAVNEVSQYGAWVLLHGYAVNHFTGYINGQHTARYADIESTVEGLKRLGVPMKATLEGSKASGLQQIATHAVMEPVPVVDDQGYPSQMDWSYAYYELAERHPIVTASGKTALFEGFISVQAQHLFEMTRLR